MAGLGSVWHWAIVLLVILLLFGAKKIPELAKGLGSGIKNFKKAVKDDEETVSDESDEHDSIESPKKRIPSPRKKTIKKKIPYNQNLETASTPKKRGRKKKAEES